MPDLVKSAAPWGMKVLSVGCLALASCVVAFPAREGSLLSGKPEARAPKTYYPTRVQSSPPSKSPPYGGWKKTKDHSLIDDSTTIVLALSADEPISHWLGDSTRPILYIRRREGALNVAIWTGCAPQPEYGRYGTATVTLRFDSKVAKEVTMNESTSSDALFARSPHSLVQKLQSYDRLVFRFTPFNSAAATTTFDLRGLRPLLETLATEPVFLGFTEPPYTDPQIIGLLGAILKVESDRREGGENKNMGVGPMNLSRSYYEEAQEGTAGLEHIKYSDLESLENSITITYAYWHRWCPEAFIKREVATLAKIHHAGTSGRHSPDAERYWQAVSSCISTPDP